MALVKEELVKAIKGMCEDLKSNNNQEDSIVVFASRLADAIHQYVIKADVTVAVNTTGSATAQSGKGTGSLS